MDTGRPKPAMDRYIKDKLRDIHTCKPCWVVKRTGSSVTVQPLTTTLYGDGTQLACHQITDVPLMTYGGGDCKITTPVKRGDLVIVLFSDRDPADLQYQKINQPQPILAENPQPLGMYPIIALPLFLTQATDKEINPTDIEIIAGGSTKVRISPSGEVEINTNKLKASGTSAEFDFVEAEFTGIVRAEDFITSLGISANNHPHTSSSPGNPTSTPIPTEV